MKHMSQSVHASATWRYSATGTASSSPVAELSIRSNRRGNASHRLKQRRLEPAGMRFFGLRQRLEPVGDLVEAFLASGARHARIHVGVFMGFAGDRGAQIVRGRADRRAGHRVADLLEEFEMAVGMAGL